MDPRERRFSGLGPEQDKEVTERLERDRLTAYLDEFCEEWAVLGDLDPAQIDTHANTLAYQLESRFQDHDFVVSELKNMVSFKPGRRELYDRAAELLEEKVSKGKKVV